MRVFPILERLISTDDGQVVDRPNSCDPSSFPGDGERTEARSLCQQIVGLNYQVISLFDDLYSFGNDWSCDWGSPVEKRLDLTETETAVPIVVHFRKIIDKETQTGLVG
jgi:hypothetical protein